LIFLDAGFLYALIDADDANHLRVKEVLERERSRKYSFVDCVSSVVMEKLGIEVAWTVDGDFQHRFTAVPGPRP
jgi:predicted nucleic acid-binding protein